MLSIRRILTESSNYDDLIRQAIINNNVIKIKYKGGDNDSVEGWRVIEPISYGQFNPKNKRYTHKPKDNENSDFRAVRGWLLKSSSDGTRSVSSSPQGKPNDPLSKMEGYRMFLLKRISDIIVTDEKFDTRKVFINKNRPKINPANDKDLNPVLTYISISNKVALDPEFIFDNIKEFLTNVIDKNFTTNKKEYLDILKDINYSDFYNDRFNSESDFNNFKNFKNKAYKIREIYNYIMLTLIGRNNFSGLRKRTRDLINNIGKSLEKKFNERINKFNAGSDNRITKDLKDLL